MKDEEYGKLGDRVDYGEQSKENPDEPINYGALGEHTQITFDKQGALEALEKAPVKLSNRNILDDMAEPILAAFERGVSARQIHTSLTENGFRGSLALFQRWLNENIKGKA